jgi:hypothetical protein
MKFQYALLRILFVLLAASSGVFSQSTLIEQLNPLSVETRGIRLYNVSASYGYYSSSYNLGTGFPLLNQANAPISTVQGSASLGWSRSGKDFNVSLAYSPAYVRGFGTSGYHSFNQNLAFSATRKLNSKWSLGTSVEGMEEDFNQLLFAPSLYSGILGTPGTLQDILSPTAGVVAGASGVPGIATGIPTVSPLQTAFLYGGREFNIGASIALAYAPSGRSTYSVFLVGDRTQFMKSGSSESQSTGLTTVLPQMTSASANVSWSYSLNPRTTVSVNGSSTRTVSRFADLYSTSFLGSVSRMLTPRWFVAGSAGTGFINPVRGLSSNATGLQKVYGGSLGYRTDSQTLVGSYLRSVADTFGIGASGSDSVSAAWNWKRPGSTFSLTGSFGYSRPVGSQFSDFHTWIGQAGVSKIIDKHFVTTVAYSYSQYPLLTALQNPTASQNGVLLAVSWSPLARR